MTKCPTRQLVPERIIKVLVGTPRCGVRTAQRAVPTFRIKICSSCVIFCPLSFRVQTNHSLLIQRAFHSPQCCDCIRARGRSEQKDCLIFREEVKVVFENEQIILLYFRIRRIGVLYSNRSIRKRAITEGVIDTDDILLWQPVALTQWPPAVLPFKKFVCEPKFERGISL